MNDRPKTVGEALGFVTCHLIRDEDGDGWLAEEDARELERRLAAAEWLLRESVEWLEAWCQMLEDDAAEDDERSTTEKKAEGLLRKHINTARAFLAPAEPQRSCATCRHEDECNGKDPCKNTGYPDWSPKR